MNKLKELWSKNKVLWVLLLILLACLIAIIIVCVTFFLGGSKTTYGDRLVDIDKYPITEEFKNDYETALESEESINSVDFDVKGRIIYVRLEFAGGSTLLEAQNKATASLEKFSEDILSYYDINFTLISKANETSEGFTIMGARNVGRSGIVWNNNTPVESD